MGLSPAEFYDLTLYEYRCYICRRAFEAAKQWEHTRFISYVMAKVNGGCKDISIIDFKPLLTDPVEPPPKPVTAEDKEDMKRRAIERAQVVSRMRKV